MMKKLLLRAICAVALVSGLNSCRTQTVALPSASPQALTVRQTSERAPIKMILDADFGSSTDDLFALMMLNHYIDDGLVDLKGIIVDREGEKNAGVVDILNTYYGHPDIPVGLERNGVKNPRCFIPYNGICDLKASDGKPLFSRSFDAAQCPDGYKLYRRLLSQAEDKSIVVVAIGFATTLAQLFESQADEYSPLNGVDLFGQKVKSVYIQSGRFEAGDSLCGYNMRAASRQSALFYSRLPHDVELIMSPSNVGDRIDYLPQDVLTDLSYTEVNPIKAVYTNFTCDTGQRMWDTNCLVNAVLGDAEYNLSPRGFVTFVDRGEESLMLFSEAPNGNARYQIPGDSYFAEQKLMDIRRHNRINHNPSAYTIEAPQPQVTGEQALAWAEPRLRLLMDKYMGSAANKLDPNDVRMLFRPVGYTGPNAADYAAAEQLIVDSLYVNMLRRAVSQGKKSLVIVTGPPASGKSTAVRQLNLKNAGLIYDASINGAGQLASVIDRARQLGVTDITLVPVYNDLLTCFRNTVNRGKQSWRYDAVNDVVASFAAGKGQLRQISLANPGLSIIPIDCSGNQGVHRVTIEQANAWQYDVAESQMHDLLTYLLAAIDEGDIEANQVNFVAGKVLELPGLSGDNLQLARQIDARVRQITEAYRMR